MTSFSSAFRVGPYDDPDRYVLGAAVASGGEGILYRGIISTATGLELDVAVKMLQPRYLDRVGEWHDRWSEQVELLRSLQVPGVVRVRDGFLGPLPHPAGEAGNEPTLYLVMNWVDGEPLNEWVRRRPDRDPFEALHLLLGVGVALDLMHSGYATGGIPVVHRDVKPSNILVTDEGAVLVDFGLTRGLPNGQRISGVTGTLGYLPPEAVDAGIYTPAADRYAFGAVAYFLFTGAEAPTEHDPAALRGCLESVPALATQPCTVDRLMAMLDADPAMRPVALANWIGQLRRSSLTSLPEIRAPEALERNPVAGLSDGRPRQDQAERPRAQRPRLRNSRIVQVLGAAAVSALLTLVLSSTLRDGNDQPASPPGQGRSNGEPSQVIEEVETLVRCDRQPILRLHVSTSAPSAVFLRFYIQNEEVGSTGQARFAIFHEFEVFAFLFDGENHSPCELETGTIVDWVATATFEDGRIDTEEGQLQSTGNGIVTKES